MFFKYEITMYLQREFINIDNTCIIYNIVLKKKILVNKIFIISLSKILKNKTL